ncbi:MAG: hypothetical protein COX30_01750 [Candidatus Moranbacteria bacterium CG23_combo_of_CG06-09_8_20_14_all_39_10]|nr:MAG: hypothetical protein COX30_01750 [Candidatus Moranbacteria bacterium CG23_combo_of_CG06-09_8_20_14_all_39_10]
MSQNIAEILRDCKSVVQGDHIVYKLGTHGTEYIDKEQFAKLGAQRLAAVLRLSAGCAIKNGLEAGGREMIGIIGPAYGAIPYALTVAESLEGHFGTPLFFPARTELVMDATGKKIHVIPEKLLALYAEKRFIGIEDIVNNGTTLRELRDLLLTIGSEMFAAISAADRGGQTAESLGIKQYFPGLRIDMDQVDLRKAVCPQCVMGVPINTVLGKGARWVKMFGQPPYPPGMDFAAFWSE